MGIDAIFNAMSETQQLLDSRNTELNATKLNLMNHIQDLKQKYDFEKVMNREASIKLFNLESEQY